MRRILGFFSEKTTDTGEDLTTKGDLHGYSTENTRIPISTNDYVLTADSSEALGLKWAAAGGATVSSQTFNQGSAETTTSTSYVATNFTLTLPTRSGGFGIVTTNFTSKNSGDNLNYFTLYDDASSVDVYTSVEGGDDFPQFNNHIFSLDGSQITLYMKTTAGTATLIYSSNAVEGNMQSLEVS